jgi:hypothetical protein
MFPDRLIAGLDLGKRADYSVLVAVSRRALPKPVAKRRYSYALRWLQAWELGTDYTATRPGKPSVIGDVLNRFGPGALYGSPLAVDYTGVGMAVVEQLTAAAYARNKLAREQEQGNHVGDDRVTKVLFRLNPVCITAGHTVMTPDETKDRSWHVPKVELIGSLVVLLENDLLKWQAPNTKGALPLIGRFEKELATFREFVTRKKNVTYGAEQSQHDDIVLATSLACWLGEHTGGGDPSGIGVPDSTRGVVGGAPDGVFQTGNNL